MRTMLLALALTLAAPVFGQQADEAGCTYCYQDGERARQQGELASALHFFLRGCERDDGASCLEASAMLSNGEGAPEDDNRAVSLGLRSCDLGYWKGCNDVGQFLVTATRPEVAAKGRELLERGCGGGWDAACETIDAIAQAERKESPREPQDEGDSRTSTTIGSMQIGQGSETATFSDVSSSCGMLQLMMAFGVAASPARQCLGASDSRRVTLVAEDGRIVESSVLPDDDIGRCVISALGRARIDGLTCRLEADVSR